MEELAIPLKLILSFILGAVIGLEREINEKKPGRLGEKPQAILGLRTFSLITVLGALTGFLYQDFLWISVLLAAASFIFFLVFYIIDTINTKDTGITTELALFFSFLIGILVALDVFPVQITIALAVVLILILSRKRKIKDVVEDIHSKELNAFVAYAIIALVILPFLPNTTYSISDLGLGSLLESFGLPVERVANIDLFNPFKLWTIVALITGIDIIGYILERTIGQKKGWILASIAGGFVSSTATTQSLAQQSRTSKRVNHLLAAALIANLVSFFQIAILMAPLNAAFVASLFPTFLAIIFAALAITFYFLRSRESEGSSKTVEETEENTEGGIFEIAPALKFAGIYLVISIFSKIALEFFGGGAFLVATAIGALAGLDAVMVNTAQLAGGRIDFSLAFWAFIIANAVNLLGKSFYSYLQGKREFAVKFAVSVGIIIASSLVGILFI